MGMKEEQRDNECMQMNSSSGVSFWQRPYAQTCLVIVLFALLSVAFFVPSIFEGRELFQQDVAGTTGIASDVKAEGGKHYWTNSIFGGMPMYQISPSYPSTAPLQFFQDFITLRKPFDIMGAYAWLLFALMGGFFFFMRSLGVRQWMSALGAVMWAFSSYFLILIAAGHIWKLTALCFIPPTLAGVVWIYKERYLRGGLLMALGVALQILANHVQMTYYFFFVMLILVISCFVESLKKKRLSAFFRSFSIMVLAGIVGVAVNCSNLYHTYEYSKETMRGGAELTLPPPGEKENEMDCLSINREGLSKEYITQWSYGVGEIWTLLVPNLKGGASGSMSQHKKEFAQTPSHIQPFLGQFSSYWGDQPFTSGPVYVGAFVFLLFTIGLFVVRGPIKWTLVVSTIFSVLLSFGKNFMPLTDFFIDWVPMYSKFRAVSSILVIAEFTIPALAVLALVAILQNPKQMIRERKAWVPAIVVLSLLFLFLIVPNVFFSFVSEQEQIFFTQAMMQDSAYAEAQNLLQNVRISVFRADVWRSLIILLLSISAIVLYAWNKINKGVVIALVSIITLADLWSVDKRYLHDEMFIPKAQIQAKAIPKTEADVQILMDKEPGYRVLNLAVSTFNDATTSNWHKSVGGYHPAKLQRYQDLIDHQLNKAIPAFYQETASEKTSDSLSMHSEQTAISPYQVLNMLNTRYIIMPTQGGRTIPIRNTKAFGPAWFVKDVCVVEDANGEMKALDECDLRKTAVVNKTFVTRDQNPIPVLSASDTASFIKLVKHSSDKVVYHSQSPRASLAVFSEIYYPHGWNLTIDGKPAEILRANYILRAAVLPKGEHEIVFEFHPRSLSCTETVAWVALGTLVTALLIWIFGRFVRRKSKSLNRYIGS